MDKRRPSFARSLSLCTACNPANPLRHHPVAILCEVLGSVHWETQWSVRGRTLCTVKISDRCQFDWGARPQGVPLFVATVVLTECCAWQLGARIYCIATDEVIQDCWRFWRIVRWRYISNFLPPKPNRRTNKAKSTTQNFERSLPTPNLDLPRMESAQLTRTGAAKPLLPLCSS